MPTCQSCGAKISRHDADYAAQLDGQGRKTQCPSCAVALHYAAVDLATPRIVTAAGRTAAPRRRERSLR